MSLGISGILARLRDLEQTKAGVTEDWKDETVVDWLRMRKRLITPTREKIRTRGEGWLDIERAAVVEFTSEDPDYPIESAFVSGEARGWRAVAAGIQTIRLIFDHPQNLSCVSLVFEESEAARTQEFVLRWSAAQEGTLKEIVRQQWNFSPPRPYARSKNIG